MLLTLAQLYSAAQFITTGRERGRVENPMGEKFEGLCISSRSSFDAARTYLPVVKEGE